MESIFVDIEVDSLQIERYIHHFGQRFNDLWYWINADTDTVQPFFWEMYEGYNVWTNDDAELAVSNTFWYGISDEITFTTGVDSVFYIAYTPCWDMPCDEAFAEFLNWASPPADTCVLIWACNTDGVYYMPERPNPKIFNMRQGEGYKLKMKGAYTEYEDFRFTTEDTSVLYSFPGKAGGDENAIASISEPHSKFRKRTQNSYPVVLTNISIEGVVPASDDEIAVFLWDTLCVGASLLGNDEEVYITAWENEIMTPEIIDGYIGGENMSFKYWDASDNEEFALNLNFATISAADPAMQEKPYTISPVFGLKAYALLSFNNAIPDIEIPETFALHQNYPNPFNPTTTIKFDLPEAARVKLVIYNMLGQKVITLQDQICSAGYKSIKWDGRSGSGAEIASGLYFNQLEVKGMPSGKNFNQVKKMMLLK